MSISSATTQAWITLATVNRSVYVKLFNHWPTRRAV
jgi:hypothetical protein